MKISTVAVSFVAAACFPAGALAGGFIDSCDTFRTKISGSVLTSNCRNLAGKYVTTSLDLNSCIGNNDGKLYFVKNGNFKASCLPESAWVYVGDRTQTFQARCFDRDIPWRRWTSKVKLNDGISNLDGQMVCPH